MALGYEHEWSLTPKLFSNQVLLMLRIQPFKSGSWLTFGSGALLNCGAHVCGLRCHRISDHTKIECSTLVEVFCLDQNHSSWIPCHRKGRTFDCKKLVEVVCPNKHANKIQCSKKNTKFDCYRMVDVVCNRKHKLKVPCHAKSHNVCQQCVEEDKEVERRAKRDLELERERKARQAEYKQQISQINDEIEHQRRMIKYRQDQEQQQKDLAQARDNLAALKQTVTRASKMQKRPDQSQSRSLQATPFSFPNGNGSMTKLPDDRLPSQAREDWEQLKLHEGAKSQALDELMDMIGLEDVKSAFLSIKSRVDTALRQAISLNDERFGCVMLGNPGTGK